MTRAILYRFSFIAMSAFLPTVLVAELDEMTSEYCDAISDGLTTLFPAEVSFERRRVDGAFCVIRDIVIVPKSRTGHRTVFKIDRFTLAGAGLSDNLHQQTPLSIGILDVDHLRVVHQIDDPVFDYLQEIRTSPFGHDIDIVSRYDPETREIVVERFDIDFPGASYIKIKQRLSGADFASLAALGTPFTDMAITEMSVEIFTNGLFESYFAPGLISSLFEGSTKPERDVIVGKLRALSLLLNTPSTVFPELTKRAMGNFINHFPRPNGLIKLHLDAPFGIGLGVIYSGVNGEEFADFRDFLSFLVLQNVTLEMDYEHIPFSD